MDNLWIWLVGATYPSEKYDFVSWDDEIPTIWKNNPVMFQSPPSRLPFPLAFIILGRGRCRLALWLSQNREPRAMLTCEREAWFNLWDDSCTRFRNISAPVGKKDFENLFEWNGYRRILSQVWASSGTPSTTHAREHEGIAWTQKTSRQPGAADHVGPCITSASIRSGSFAKPTKTGWIKKIKPIY